MDPDVSIGELTRIVSRLDTTVGSLSTIVTGLKDTLDQRYQRRDLAEAEAANILARIQDVASDVRDVRDDMDEDRKARIAGNRWGIGLALTAIALLISATSVMIVVLPGLVQP